MTEKRTEMQTETLIGRVEKALSGIQGYAVDGISFYPMELIRRKFELAQSAERRISRESRKAWIDGRLCVSRDGVLEMVLRSSRFRRLASTQTETSVRRELSCPDADPTTRQPFGDEQKLLTHSRQPFGNEQKSLTHSRQPRANEAESTQGILIGK